MPENESRMVCRYSAATIAMGAIAGVVGGLALGVLYAPQSGEETRAMIKEKARETSQRANELAGEAGKTARRFTRKGQEFVKDRFSRKEDTMNETEYRTGSSALAISIGILIGVAAGLAVGFLYAPRSGSETRQMVMGKTREMGDRASEFVGRVKEAASRVRGSAEEAAETARQEARSI